MTLVDLVLNPYLGNIFNYQNPVDMIGHDAKFVQSGIREMAGNIFPISFGNDSDRGENHGLVFYDSKNQFSVLGTDGQEIFSSRRIVAFTQTYRTAALNFRIEFHCVNLSLNGKFCEYFLIKSKWGTFGRFFIDCRGSI